MLGEVARIWQVPEGKKMADSLLGKGCYGRARFLKEHASHLLRITEVLDSAAALCIYTQDEKPR
jgi:hypothetical protein